MNSTATDLVLNNGAVSASMLAKGGPGLQDECKSKYPQGIKVGEVAKTAGHGLGCRVVYHLALCPWSNPQASQVSDLCFLFFFPHRYFFFLCKGINLQQNPIMLPTDCHLTLKQFL